MMKKRNLLHSGVLALLLAACSTTPQSGKQEGVSCPNDESVTVINLTNRTDSICLLSEIADSIEYYPIHSTDINDMDEVELLPDYIWSNYRNDSVRGSLFCRTDGKMIKETNFSAFTKYDGLLPYCPPLNTLFPLKDKNTLINRTSKIKGLKRFWFSVSYNPLTGTLTDDVDFPYDDGIAYFRLNESYLLKEHRIIGDDIHSCYKIDWYSTSLDSIKQDILPDTVFQTYISWNQTKVHLLKDKIYFHMPTMKTIYEISPQHSPIPIYRYEVGTHNHPYKGIKDVAKYWKDESEGLLSCYAIRSTIIAENYLFGVFNYKGFIHRVLFNRKTNQKWVIPTKSTTDRRTLEGIVNDLDGGLDFWPKKVSLNGEIYTWYNVEDLREKVQQSVSQQVKNQEATKRLKKMLNDLPEDVKVIVAVLKEK